MINLKRIRDLPTSRRALGEALAWTGNRHAGRLRIARHTRKDHRQLPMGEHARVEVYWKLLPIGRGPGASLFILDEEILRFDCFGPEAGHMHAAYFQPARGQDRLYFPEKTIPEQIDRAVFEVVKNLRYHQSRVCNVDVRRVKLDQDVVAQTMIEAGELMHGFLTTVEQLQDR